MVRFLSPVVVSFGDEDYFLDQDLADYRNQPDRTVIFLNGPELANDYELVSLCQTQMADLRPRVIVVDNAQKVKAEKSMKAYVDSLSPKNLNVVLALIFRDGKLPAFWTKLGDKASLKERKKLKTFETNNEVVKWIDEELRRADLKADSRVANVFYAGTGPNLYRISNEIRKLKLLVGEGNSVTIEHLQSILTVGANVDVWQVIDAAANKDMKKAINLLTSLYKHSSDDPTILLSYSLMKQVERMFVASNMLNRGASEEEIATRVQMHPWRCRTFFLPMVKKHTSAGLGLKMQELCKLDVEVKRTAFSKRTLIELAVLSLAS